MEVVGTYLDNVGIHDCKLFSSALGPLQTAQRAELRCFILGLQVRTSAHIGGDNLKGLDEQQATPLH